MLITQECNLKCRICSAKYMMRDNARLSMPEIEKFIKKIADFNPSIFIGGGEPFMRGDIFDIFKVIKKNNLRFGVVTNGVLIEEDKINTLLTVQPQVMIFSVYGPRKLHEDVVGQKGAFNRLSENIKYLNAKRKNMRLILNCVIGEENYQYLEEMVVLGRKMGVDFVRFEHLIFLSNKEYDNHMEVSSEIFPRHMCELATYIKEIDSAEIGRTLEKTIPYLRKKYKKFVLFKPYLNSRELSLWYKSDFFLKRRCFFTQHSLFIKPNGDIVPCQFFNNFVLGNILKDDLIRVWRSPERRSFSRLLNKRLLPGCMRCCKL
ncbi:MAG: radical SAM protein [Candidatus Omnitrophica bacterium]|nr:radical SAM protein [Candidatus Omnitrophota bacterium]